jgi:1-deoxy-D-xylulose-5-phosphate reductoisomerase
LTFEAPDPTRFPALAIAKAALAAGGTAPTVMNAADEVAVAAFLERRIGFLDIARVVEETLTRMEAEGWGRRNESDVLETAYAADATARRVAEDVARGLMASA